MSEPDFLLSVMDRHAEGCAVVSLVGGGQEINTGEAGLSQWLAALTSARARLQMNTESPGNLHDGIEARFGAGCERLVETLTAEARVFGHLGHSSGTRNVTKRKQQQIEVACFEHSRHVFGHGRFVLQVARGIEGEQLACFCAPAHDSSSNSRRMRWARAICSYDRIGLSEHDQALAGMLRERAKSPVTAITLEELIELDVDGFTHEYIGQLNTHVTWYREHEMSAGTNPPVGLPLCTEKNHALVKYARAGMHSRLFVSKYQLELPDEAQMRTFLERQRRECSTGSANCKVPSTF